MANGAAGHANYDHRIDQWANAPKPPAAAARMAREVELAASARTAASTGGRAGATSEGTADGAILEGVAESEPTTAASAFRGSGLFRARMGEIPGGAARALQLPRASRSSTAARRRPLRQKVLRRDDGMVVLKVRDRSGEVVLFRLKRTTTMRAVFRAWAERMSVDAERCHFEVKGVRVQPGDTAASLGLAESDVVEVLLVARAEGNMEG